MAWQTLLNVLPGEVSALVNPHVPEVLREAEMVPVAVEDADGHPVVRGVD